jgi:hypothetical protein
MPKALKNLCGGINFPKKFAISQKRPIDTYEMHRFAVSRSRSKVKVICVLVAKLKKNHIKSPVQSLLMKFSTK